MRRTPPADVSKAVFPPWFRASRALAAASLALLLAACGGAPAGESRRTPAASAAQRVDAAPTVVINEIMADPSTAEPDTEWFEVYNPGDAPVDLQGWTIQSSNDQPHTIAASVVVPPSGYAVLARTDARATTGVVPSYVYGAGLTGAATAQFNNAADSLALLDADGRTVDEVAYTSKPSTNASRGLVDWRCDNHEVMDARWATSTTTFGPTSDKGTPGKANGFTVPETCPNVTAPTGEVRINEVMARPTTGDLGAGEWFEVYNPGTTRIDLGGWKLQSGGEAAYVLPAGAFIDPGAYLVFGRSADRATNGGVPVDVVYASIALGNSSDTLSLSRPGAAGLPDVLVDSVNWSSNVSTGASRGLMSPSSIIASNVGQTAWATSTANWTVSSDPTLVMSTDKGSPGRANPIPTSGGSTQPIPSVSVSIQTPAHMPVGYMKPAFATVKDASGTAITPAPAVEWSSENPAVVTVDARGYLTAVGPGSANVTALYRYTNPDGSAGQVSGSALLSVTPESDPSTATFRDHLAFGTPHDATPGDEVVVTHPQFVTSFNPARGGPNWVAWDLNATQFGPADRCNCFTPDATLPAGTPVVEDYDYRNGGYDRGHMVQSESRTDTDSDNAATFLTSNILPQAAANNQGPWSKLETYLNDLVRNQGKEVYVVAGGWFPAQPATLKNEGKVAIPDYTWKVAVVVDAGKGLADVATASDVRVIAVWMPNRVSYTGAASADAIRNMAWESFSTSVDYIEAQTGYDLLDLLADDVETAVEGGNAFPVASTQSVAVAEDGSVAVTLDGTDYNGDALSYRVVTQPAHGALSGTAPNLTYTPAANYDGTDSFTYVANDGTGDSLPAKVSLTVTPVNDAPLASAKAVSLAEDGSLAVTLAGTDVDGDALTFTVVTPPAHGSLSGTAPNLTYAPAPNYNGADAFSFTVSDGQVTSAAAEVSISIAAVNDRPVALAQSVGVDEDGQVDVTAAGTDVEGDVLTYALVGAPAHGTLTGTLPDVTYVPAANYFGPDSFTFTVSDGQATSVPGAVSLTVRSVNDAPVASGDVVAVVEDTASAVHVSAADPDGDALTYAVVVAPRHGTLSGAFPDVTYTPSADFNGEDAFAFTVTDGTATSVPATVTLQVSAVSDAPVAQARSATVNEDASAPVTLAGTDADGDVLTFRVVTQPVHGTLGGTAPELTYTPEPDYSGPDTFSFVTNDGVGDSQPATVSVTVTPVNDAPVATAQAVQVAEDGELALTLGGTDVEGDWLGFTVTTQPAHGTLTGTAPNLTYTPEANYHGPDHVTFTVSDGQLTSEPATVSLDVTPVDDAPAAVAAALSTREDESLAITLVGTDPDADALGYDVVQQPEHGTLSGTAPNLTYTPAPDFHGTDAFAFTVTDGQDVSAPAQVSLTVTEVNDVPVALAQALGVDEDGRVDLTVSGTDADGDALTFELAQAPAHGTLTGTFPDVTYVPAADYHGDDTFTFTASDGQATSAAASVSLTVRAVNDAPVATARSASVAEDGEVQVLSSGTDVDGDGLTYTVTAQPEHGTLGGTAPALTYTPAPDYHGPDAFAFTVSDGQATSAAAQVALTVTPVNDAPVAVAQSLSTEEGSALPVVLAGTDVDGDALTYRVVTQPAHGALTGLAPRLTYTPAAGYSGADAFTFEVSDGTATSAAVAVQLTITAKPASTSVNEPPVAQAQTLSLDEDGQLAVVLTGHDPEGVALTYTLASQPSHGQLTGTPPELTYTPDADFHGTDSFTFTVGDGQATSTEARVTFDVAPVNDAPAATAATYTLRQGETRDVALAGADVDGDALTYEVDTAPQGGTLLGTAPALVYQPNAGFRGEDHFTYRVRDAAGATASATVTVTVQNVAPLASASASGLTPLEGELVRFTATASDPGGDTLTYAWDFGDGTTSSEPEPSHAWTSEGAHEVSLTVSDGEASAAVALLVTVQNASPLVTSVTAPAQSDEGQALQFAATASDPGGDALTYAWDFGDGTPAAAGARVSHTYADDGHYTARLTVTDDAGASTTSTRDVDVHNLAPQPVAVGTLSARPDVTLTFSLRATDAGGTHDPLTWTLVSGPGALAADGTYRWTPARDQQGTSPAVEAEVADDDGGRTRVHFNVSVARVATSGAEDKGGCAAAAGLPSAWALLVVAAALGQRRRRRTHLA